MQQIDDLVYYDSNSDDYNKDNVDTFHNFIQVEDMIDDTYNNNDNVNRKPTNNVIDYGDQRLTIYIINYIVSAKLEWSLKKYRVDNIKFDQKKELKQCNHTDANKEDQVYWKPNPLDHLDSISSIPDLYSAKQRIQPNNHDHLKQDLQGPLKHVYNKMTYYGEQRLTQYIINYCFGSINRIGYDMRFYTYCHREHYILFNIGAPNKQKRQGKSDDLCLFDYLDIIINALIQ